MTLDQQAQLCAGFADLGYRITNTEPWTWERGRTVITMRPGDNIPQFDGIPTRRGNGRRVRVVP